MFLLRKIGYFVPIRFEFFRCIRHSSESGNPRKTAKLKPDRYKSGSHSVFNLLGILVGFFLLFSGSTSFSEERLISVTLSRSENVSYVSITPLHYKARREGQNPIHASPGASFGKSMELGLFTTCDRVEPQKGSVIGLRPQFLHVYFLLRPHPDDLSAAYYLSPVGLFRMLKHAFRGHPYFEEEGTIKLPRISDAVWDVHITREDITATSPENDYSIEFSHMSDQPKFIQVLQSSVVFRKGTPQVTVLLESPRLYVRATYALKHKGAYNYQEVKSMNILDWWRK